MKLETWPDMRKRHRRELIHLVEFMAKERFTQAEAARKLGMTRTHLNNVIQREGIFWPVIRQGTPSREFGK